jgi:hypothetical protein
LQWQPSERGNGSSQVYAMPPACAGYVVEKTVDYFREFSKELQDYPLAKPIYF